MQLSTAIFYSYISGANHDRLIKENLLSLSKSYQTKIKGYNNWQDAQLSLLGLLLLKKALKINNLNHDLRDINLDIHNKPYFQDNRISFNISHSGDLAVCTVSNIDKIGIDIELMKSINLRDFKEQMTYSEWHKVITAKNKLEEFYEYWTQKEAVLKATGIGLSLPLKSFEINEKRVVLNSTVFLLEDVEIDYQYKCYLAFEKMPEHKIHKPQMIVH